MLRYIARRLGMMVLTLLVASIIVFFVTQMLPGDVATMIIGRFATPEALAKLRAQLGLDRPTYIQYLDWLRHYVTGDWGKSLSTGSPIQPMVMERLRNSALLGGMAMLMSVPLAIVLGVIAAFKRNSWVDHLISVSALALVGLPEFVTGLFLIGVFALGLHLLPASSDESAFSQRYSELPATLTHLKILNGWAITT